MLLVGVAHPKTRPPQAGDIPGGWPAGNYGAENPFRISEGGEAASQISLQISNIFQAYGDPDQVIADPGIGSLLQ